MAEHYVLLVRHAAGYKPYHSGEDDERPSQADPALLVKGERQARSVAWRLREVVDELPTVGAIRVAATWCSPEPEPMATARLVTASWLPAPKAMEALAPRAFGPQGGSSATVALDAVVHDIEKFQADDESGNALLIIGHEPQLGWIAHRLSHKRVPIDQGELVCLRRSESRRWNLLWTIHPDDRAALADIREKIRSKMDAAKVMGGFITALVTFVLAQFIDDTKVDSTTWCLRVATVTLLLVAATFFFLSLFWYDTLLMPTRFWCTTAPKKGVEQPAWLVARPPSSSAWVLYQNMMRIWNRTFVPATVLVGVALVLFSQAILEPTKLADWWPMLASITGFAALAIWIHLSKPRLGAQD